MLFDSQYPISQHLLTHFQISRQNHITDMIPPYKNEADKRQLQISLSLSLSSFISFSHFCFLVLSINFTMLVTFMKFICKLYNSTSHQPSNNNLPDATVRIQYNSKLCRSKYPDIERCLVLCGGGDGVAVVALYFFYSQCSECC